jgi:hypothetical protein
MDPSTAVPAANRSHSLSENERIAIGGLALVNLPYRGIARSGWKAIPAQRVRKPTTLIEPYLRLIVDANLSTTLQLSSQFITRKQLTAGDFHNCDIPFNREQDCQTRIVH